MVINRGSSGRIRISWEACSSLGSRPISFCMSAIISTTRWFAPPCLGPFNEPMDALMVEKKSDPVEATTTLVKVELFPPP